MVPCNALPNMLLINRNEILLGSPKDQLRRDLNYEVSQKELIRFFYLKRLSHAQALRTRKEGKECEHFTLEETAKQGLCMKVWKSVWSQWHRRNLQLLLLPVFCWLKASVISHLWISASQQQGLDGLAGLPEDCGRLKSVSGWICRMPPFCKDVHRRQIHPYLCFPTIRENQTLPLCTSQTQTSLTV